MKGVISFRGVGIPENRDLLIEWRKNNGIAIWPLEDQFDLALTFFKEPLAEDKLAGILFIQNFLYDKLDWRVMVNKYEKIYKEKLIFDWNICDWFCVRVLGSTIKVNGSSCAKAISKWSKAKYLWQARSSVVALANLVSTSKYYGYIKESASLLIRREERFAKTAVGWILREISKYDEEFVISFIENNLSFFSKESLGNALKYFDKNKKKSIGKF